MLLISKRVAIGDILTCVMFILFGSLLQVCWILQVVFLVPDLGCLAPAVRDGDELHVVCLPEEVQLPTSVVGWWNGNRHVPREPKIQDPEPQTLNSRP